MGKSKYLPPASEGWGNVLFSVCLSVHTLTGGGVSHHRYGQACTPSQVWTGCTTFQVWIRGYPIRGLDMGYPIPGLDRRVPRVNPPARSGWWEGTQGTPLTRSGRLGGSWGTPSHVWMLDYPRYPRPGLDGGGTEGNPLARFGWWGVPRVTPWPGLDGWGVPGVPPSQVWMVGGTPLARSGWWGGTQGTLKPGLDGGGIPPTCQDWMGYPPLPPH